MNLHRDERGSISLATVFALLLLTFLLGMVLNVGRQVDNKIKMQNAADAATYSGGIVLARGMNTLAFSNHLLCEVFAVTAILREGRDRHAEPLVPEILAAWDAMAPELQKAPNSPPLDKFQRAGNAIPKKTPLEQEMVRAFSEWIQAASDLLLPVFEQVILDQELIPAFEQDVVQVTPAMAQIATARIAQQHTGQPAPHDSGRPQIDAILWRLIVDPVGGSSESAKGTLPAVNPKFDSVYQLRARNERRDYAMRYLRQWNDMLMQPFDSEGQMSQFGRLWRGFTCGQLEKLLDEHADRNFPFLIRPQLPERNARQEREYQFVGVAYRRKMTPAIPRLFRDSLLADNQTFAEGMLFVPQARIVDIRFVWSAFYQTWVPSPIREAVPEEWNLWNQHWTFQLVPATSDAVPAILGQSMASPYIATTGNSLPNLSNVSSDYIRRLTTH